MPTPKSVTLAGKEFQRIDDVEISVETPCDERGEWEGRTQAPLIKLTRNKKSSPTIDMFKHTTNDNGSLRYIDGKIVLQNGDDEETYTIEFTKGYIESWTFIEVDLPVNQTKKKNKKNKGKDDIEDTEKHPAVEEICIRSGEISIAAAGKNKMYKVYDWPKTSK